MGDEVLPGRADIADGNIILQRLGMYLSETQARLVTCGTEVHTFAV